jgi:hypothetical protein
MPVQRDLAHANNEDTDMILIIHVGNAHIGVSTVKVEGQPIPNPDGSGEEFKDSFQVNLKKAGNLIRKEIEVSSEIAPNPAITDKTLLLTYDLTNARFFTGKNRTLISSDYNGSDSFRVTITVI